MESPVEQPHTSGVGPGGSDAKHVFAKLLGMDAPGDAVAAATAVEAAGGLPGTEPSMVGEPPATLQPDKADTVAVRTSANLNENHQRVRLADPSIMTER